MTNDPLHESRRSNPDFIARGLASEAMQATRSHEQYDNLRFENVAEQHKEIKTLITDLRRDMNLGFKSYDAKFWSLAITVIATLLSVVGVLSYQILFHH